MKWKKLTFFNCAWIVRGRLVTRISRGIKAGLTLCLLIITDPKTSAAKSTMSLIVSHSKSPTFRFSIVPEESDTYFPPWVKLLSLPERSSFSFLKETPINEYHQKHLESPIETNRLNYPQRKLLTAATREKTFSEHHPLLSQSSLPPSHTSYDPPAQYAKDLDDYFDIPTHQTEYTYQMASSHA